MLRGGLILGLTLMSACSSDGASRTMNGGGDASGGTSGSTALAGASGAGRAGSTAAGVGGAVGNAGADSAGSAGANSAGASCNTLLNSAPEIAETPMTGDAPTPVGGTITDGTYYQTAFLVYNPPTNPTNTLHKLTVKIEGLLFQAVFRDETGAELRTTIELAPSGTALGEQQTCRTNARYMMNMVNVLGYDATPTTFTIHGLLNQPEGDTVQVFTKQN
jgi:hypothetical protein